MAMREFNGVDRTRQAQLLDLPSAGPAQPRTQDGALLAQLCAWIDQHLHEDIGWDRLMRISGLSPAQLQQLFQRELKTTPMMYIRGRRQQAGAGG